MSDSDSDANFESADEDTEHDLSEKSSKSNAGTNCTEDKNLVLCEKFESTVSVNSDAVDCSDRIETLSNEAIKSQLVASEHSGDTKASQPDLGKSSLEELTQKETISENVPQESKRVTLRLEKKLQEKNKQFSKANSIEKEQFASNQCNKSSEEPIETSSWGFGSWGTSLLSTAASSVSTFTNQVSQGIGTVFETVESSLGAPPPEELADSISKRKESYQDSKVEDKKDDSENQIEECKTSGTSLLTGVTSWTKALESTGTKVIMGGLDTLELIGKKTIDILTEGDPGLRKKRAAFSQGITLSQLLREAKTKADEQKESESQDNDDAIYYSLCFDDFQGLVHLEALEMLSGQSLSKVQSLMIRSSSNTEMKEKLDEIKSICENLPPTDDTPDDEKQQNFNAAFLEHVQALNLPISMEKIIQVQKKINDWLTKCHEEQAKGEVRIAKEIYHEAIKSLAEFTAKCVEQFHKITELILVQPKLEPSAVHCATHLTGLTTVLCLEVCIMSSRFCFSLDTAADDSEDPDSVTPMITSVYLEASNSTTYIQDAYQLLVPVLQQSLMERSI